MKIRYVNPDDLVQKFDNPRIMKEGGLQKLIQSIERFGWTTPVLVQRGTMGIIAGHQRVKAAKAQGIDKIPVLELDLNDIQAQLYSIADNRLADEAEWDADLLVSNLKELEALGYDLLATGLTEKEISENLRMIESLQRAENTFTAIFSDTDTEDEGEGEGEGEEADIPDTVPNVTEGDSLTQEEDLPDEQGGSSGSVIETPASLDNAFDGEIDLGAIEQYTRL